jgi:Flp pilus assembly protein TadB
MSDIHEHLEHAEHEEHNISDPLNRKVAFSMAVVAALLAGVSMLGHRAHNDTLRLQTEAGNLKVVETDTWAQYQAKRVRQQLNENTHTLILLMGESSETKGAREQAQKRLREDISRYADELREIKKQAEEKGEEAKHTEHEAHLSHERANWLDFAHLAVELGLILCSIALLTKKPEYWLSGLVSAGLSLGLVAAAFTVVH